MKKLIAILICALLCLPYTAAAAEAVQQEQNDNTLVSYEDVTFELDEDAKASALSCTQLIGNYYFTTPYENVPVVVRSGELSALLANAYGSVIGDDALDALVEFITEKQSSGDGRFEGWNVQKSVPDATEPYSTTPTEQPTAASELPTEPYAPSEPSASDPTDPCETAPATNAPTQPSTQKPTQVHTEAPWVQPPTQKDNTDSVDAEFSPKLNLKSATVKAGKVFWLRVTGTGGKKVSFSSSNKKRVRVTSKGKVSALSRGYSLITAKVGNKKLKCAVKVVSNPKLSKKSLRVRKGRFRTVYISGKAKTFRNTYAINKYARISARRTSTKFRVVGKKRGLTTLRLRVNGYLLKLRVRVV